MLDLQRLGDRHPQILGFFVRVVIRFPGPPPPFVGVERGEPIPIVVTDGIDTNCSVWPKFATLFRGSAIKTAGLCRADLKEALRTFSGFPFDSSVAHLCVEFIDIAVFNPGGFAVPLSSGNTPKMFGRRHLIKSLF